MQTYRILRYCFFVLFIVAISQTAISKTETFRINTGSAERSGISQDSISKSEIADYRKRFEAIEKMINSKRGTYEDARRSLETLRNSRVRNLQEFSGRFSAMQQKLTAWNLEINPKVPPVKEPVNPNTPPKTTAQTSEQKAGQVAEQKLTTTDKEATMLSYFPDTMTVGTDFLAYVEITRDNNVQLSTRGSNVNSTIDKFIISSSAIGTSVMSSSVTVELGLDGGNQNFTINPRSDSRTKTLTDNGSARWEWNISPNAAGDTRLKLTVKYQRQNPDGTMQEVSAISKVFVVRCLAKSETTSDNLPWIILGVVVLLALIGYLVYTLSRGKNKNVEHRHVSRTDRRDVNRRDVDVDRDIDKR